MLAIMISVLRKTFPSSSGRHPISSLARSWRLHDQGLAFSRSLRVAMTSSRSAGSFSFRPNHCEIVALSLLPGVRCRPSSTAATNFLKRIYELGANLHLCLPFGILWLPPQWPLLSPWSRQGDKEGVRKQMSRKFASVDNALHHFYCIREGLVFGINWTRI